MKKVIHRNVSVKTLSVSVKTHHRLREIGHYGESADELLNRIIDAFQKKNNSVTETEKAEDDNLGLNERINPMASKPGDSK